MFAQYTANFNDYKNDNFSFSFLNIFFFIFAQNTNCGYKLELPQ